MHTAATIAAVLLTDRIGRRVVLMTGAAVCTVGQAVSLVLAATITDLNAHVQLAFDAFYTIVAVRRTAGNQRLAGRMQRACALKAASVSWIVMRCCSP